MDAIKIPRREKHAAANRRHPAVHKSTVDTHLTAVIATGDDAATSKLSAVDLQYYTDIFIRHFVHYTARRPPLINRGYYARVKAVTQLVTDFITAANADNVACQIVSLGAGSDTTFFRLNALASPIRASKWFEIDFPSAMNRKAAIIQHNEPLASALTNVQYNIKEEQQETGVTVLDSDQFALISADMSDVSALTGLLERVHCDMSKPTLFLAECVLIYMPPTVSASIIEWSASTFTGGCVFASYEQIHPHDPFGRVMMSNLTARGCSLLGLTAYPDIPSQRQRYTTAGYSEYVGWDMGRVYSEYLDRADVKRIERLELFDEFEEWNLIQSHYHISLAAKQGTHHHSFEQVGMFRLERTTTTAQTKSDDSDGRRIVSPTVTANDGRTNDVRPSPSLLNHQYSPVSLTVRSTINQ